MKRAVLVLALLAVVVETPAHGLTGRATITSVTLSEQIEDTTIDVVQDTDCNNDGAATTTDIEPFYDTTARLVVSNGLNRSIRITRFWYRVRVGGRIFTSRKVGIIGGGYVSSNAATEIASLFAHARGGAKYLIRSSTPISADTGVRNITVFLSGDDGTGSTLTLRSSTVADFTDADNCSS